MGTEVRIADRAFPDEFKATWQYHHKLRIEQLDYADSRAVVDEVGYYRGGDPVYTLSDVPGLWLEQCLRPPR